MKKKFSLVQRYQTEKAIIDALLKISEIIKKTTNINQHSKKKLIYDNKKEERNEYEIYNTSTSSPMHTFKSYNSNRYRNPSLSQQTFNYNRAPIYHSALKKRRYNNDYRDQESYYYIPSSLSDNNYHRKRSSRSDKRRRMKCKCHTSYDDDEYSASDC